MLSGSLLSVKTVPLLLARRDSLTSFFLPGQAESGQCTSSVGSWRSGSVIVRNESRLRTVKIKARFPWVFTKENHCSPPWTSLTSPSPEVAWGCFCEDRSSCPGTQVSVQGEGKRNSNLELSSSGKQETKKKMWMNSLLCDPLWKSSNPRPSHQTQEGREPRRECSVTTHRGSLSLPSREDNLAVVGFPLKLCSSGTVFKKRFLSHL